VASKEKKKRVHISHTIGFYDSIRSKKEEDECKSDENIS
jgi:hypothetical protein